MKKEESYYLSGKMSGLADLNRPKFNAAEDLLYSLFGRGVIVINPHTLAMHEPKTWENFMRNDIRAMLRCSNVVVLDDWQNSRGAIIEVLLANALGIVIRPIDDPSQRVKISFLMKVQLGIKLLLNHW